MLRAIHHVAIICSDYDRSRDSYSRILGLRHLAFAVHDIAAAQTWLEAQGVAVEPIRTDVHTGRHFTFFADPDGLPIELYEDG